MAAQPALPDPDRIAQAGLKLAQPTVGGGAIWWLEGRPAEGGRVALMRAAADGERELLPGRSVRSRVHEYGGGAFTVAREGVAFVDDADQQVWWLPGAGDARSLAARPGVRHADLAIDVVHAEVLAVSEDGRRDAHRPERHLVALGLAGEAPRILHQGADFYAAPRASPDGRALCWLEWDADQMPWDATRLMLAERRTDGSLGAARCVAGGPTESVCQPEWGADGTLWFVSDRSGRWQVERLRHGVRQTITQGEAERGLPHWQFGMRTYGLLDADTLVVAGSARALWRLERIDLISGRATRLAPELTQCDHLHAADGRVVVLAGGPRTPLAVRELTAHDGHARVLRPATTLELDPATLSEPEAIEFASEGGSAWALCYLPVTACGPAPAVVRCHGGPTAAASSALDARIQAFTARGIAWCEVDYRGSTGFGRAYRNALDGQWGVIDAADCRAAAAMLVTRGLAHAGRLVLAGSSAGGYTALAAALGPGPFRGLMLQYPVVDLISAMRDTHAFEARYGDRLLGPWPAARAVWEARSPLARVAALRIPVLLAHGEADPVVPIDQSERMAGALSAAGVPVRLVRYPGEGHGFRRATTIAMVLRDELAFVGQV